MSVTRKNEIYFPHIFPGHPKRNVIGDETFTYNSIDGGFRDIEDFGYLSNTFLGGNVARIGLMKKYGFYACPHTLNKEIIAFCVIKASDVTKEGRKLLAKRFPGMKIIYSDYERVTDVPQETAEERAKAIADFEAAGGNPIMVRRVSAREIVGLVKALKSGRTEKPIAETESAVAAPAAAPTGRPMTHSAGKGKPPKQIVDAMVSAARESE